MIDCDRMKLVVNTLSVDSSKGGIRTYLTEMLQALTNERPGWKFTVVCSRLNIVLFKETLEGRDNVNFVVLPFSITGALARITMDQLLIPFLRPWGRYLLTPSNVATVLWLGKQLVVVQAPFALKNIRNENRQWSSNVSRFHRIYYDLGFRLNVLMGVRMIAVSNYLAKKIGSLFPRARVSVIHEGARLEATKERRSQKGGHVLFVSTLFPYKRLDSVITAMKLLENTSDPRLAKLKLIVCGKDPDGQQFDRAIRQADALGIGDKIVLKGNLNKPNLAEMYRNAFVLVYPSEVETFGLPVLEAMSFGVPVVCSNRMSVPEVGEAGGGIIVDPGNAQQIADAIARLWNADAFRLEKINLGYTQVDSFSWSKCGSEIAQEMEKL